MTAHYIPPPLPHPNPSDPASSSWCHQHLAWECSFIWNADNPDPTAPRLCCHLPFSRQSHDHPSPNAASLAISAGDLTRFKDSVHTATLERIREECDHPSLHQPGEFCLDCGRDTSSLAMPADEVGPWWCTACSHRWQVLNEGGTGVCTCGNERFTRDAPSQAKPAEKLPGFEAKDMFGNCRNCPSHATAHVDGICPQHKPDPYLWYDGSDPAAPGGGVK